MYYCMFLGKLHEKKTDIRISKDWWVILRERLTDGHRDVAFRRKGSVHSVYRPHILLVSSALDIAMAPETSSTGGGGTIVSSTSTNDVKAEGSIIGNCARERERGSCWWPRGRKKNRRSTKHCCQAAVDGESKRHYSVRRKEK